MEKLGYPKRYLLVSRVQQARDSQQAAKEQFQSVLERFRAVVNFRGGELEATRSWSGAKPARRPCTSVLRPLRT
jgi:hypothetical protein